MIGDMQKWTPNVASIIEHAKNLYPKQEVISRMILNQGLHKLEKILNFLVHQWA